MSHCSKTQVAEQYKITFLVITFLFGNGFQLWDMQNIQYDNCDGSEAYRPAHLWNWAWKMSKTG